MQRLEPAFCHAYTHHPSGAHRLAEPFETVHAKVGKVEPATIRRRVPGTMPFLLVPPRPGGARRGEIGCLADYRLFLGSPLAD